MNDSYTTQCILYTLFFFLACDIQNMTYDEEERLLSLLRVQCRKNILARCVISRITRPILMSQLVMSYVRDGGETCHKYQHQRFLYVCVVVADDERHTYQYHTISSDEQHLHLSLCNL